MLNLISEDIFFYIILIQISYHRSTSKDLLGVKGGQRKNFISIWADLHFPWGYFQILFSETVGFPLFIYIHPHTPIEALFISKFEIFLDPLQFWYFSDPHKKSKINQDLSYLALSFTKFTKPSHTYYYEIADIAKTLLLPPPPPTVLIKYAKCPFITSQI